MTTRPMIHHAGRRAESPPKRKTDPAPSDTTPIAVHGPSPPACASTANPNDTSRSRPIAQPVDRQPGEPVARADHADRADRRGEPHARGEELEDDQRQPHDEEEVRGRGPRAPCRTCAPTPRLSNTTSWFGWRRRSRPSPMTFAVERCTSPAAVRTVLPSSVTIVSPSVGRTPSMAARSGARPPARGNGSRVALRPRHRDRCRSRGARLGAHVRDRRCVRLVDPDRVRRTEVRAGGGEGHRRRLEEEHGSTTRLRSRGSDPDDDRDA